MKRACHILLLCALASAAGLLSGTTDAAPDGYVTRTFSVYGFTIHYPVRLEAMAEKVENILAASVPDVAGDIGLETIQPIDVYLAPDEGAFRKLHRGIVPEWGSAYSVPAARKMVIDAAAVLRAPRPLEVVIRHELSHLLLEQRVGGVRCPTWFVEGLAMVQSHEWTFTDQWNLVTSVANGRVPMLEDLEEPFPLSAEKASLAYRVSFIAVEELLRERPGELITFTSFIRELGSFDDAFRMTFGHPPEDFSERLHAVIIKRYRTAGRLIHSAPYWLPIGLLFILAYVLKRIRNRRTLKRWELEGPAP